MTKHNDLAALHDYFNSLCDALAASTALPASMRKTKAAQQSYDHLEQAALSVLPKLIKHGMADQLLLTTARTGSPALLEALPERERPRLVSFDGLSNMVDTIAKADIRFLRALRRAGCDMAQAHASLVRRALLKDDHPLQEFLLEACPSPSNALGWVFHLKPAHYAKAPEFFSAYLLKLVAAYPDEARSTLNLSLRSCAGLPTVLMLNAGLPLDAPDDWVPDRTKQVLSALSAHARLTLFGHGRDIASFWKNRKSIEAAAALF